MNRMEAELQKFREASDMVNLYGPTVVRALIILLVGLLLAKLFLKYSKPILRRMNMKEATLSVVTTVIFIVIITFSVAMAAQFLGLKATVIVRVLTAISLSDHRHCGPVQTAHSHPSVQSGKYHQDR